MECKVCMLQLWLILAILRHGQESEGNQYPYRITRLPLDFTCPAADKQTTARTILCIRRPLFSPISTNSKQNLFLQHSEVRANFRTPPRPFHAYAKLQITCKPCRSLPQHRGVWASATPTLRSLKLVSSPRIRMINGASRPRIRARVAPSPSTLLEAGRARNSTYLLWSQATVAAVAVVWRSKQSPGNRTRVEFASRRSRPRRR